MIQRLSIHWFKIGGGIFYHIFIARLQNAIKNQVYKEHYGDGNTIDNVMMADDHDSLIY